MHSFDFRYLATGCYLVELHYTYRIGKSTASEIVRTVCSAIWTCLRGQCLPQPTEEMWKDIANGFQNRANFPNCLGAIDGKHVRVVKPKMSGSLYYNYKEFFSIVLLGVADSDYKFVFVDIGSFGKDSDSTIFQKSALWARLIDNTLDIPHPAPLPNTDGIVTPYMFVGDEAFGLSEYVQRPYGGKMLSHKKKIFNYRLSRARRYVECTFGIMSNKWRVFHRAMNVNVDFAVDITKACCVLHNFVRVRDGHRIEDTLTVEGFESFMNLDDRRRTVSALRNRDILADYFVSDSGKVPWQESRI